MNILIIGGTRFVGPYIIQKLLRHGHQLTIFNRGTRKLSMESQIRFVKGDRNEGFKMINDHFDAVIDMCSYNGLQTKTAISSLKFDYFFNFGSVAAYKKSSIFPLREEYDLGEWPHWGKYNQGKVECEKVLKQSHIKFASIRPVYILGRNNCLPRESYIYSKLMRRQIINLPGNGQALIQFVFVQDVARAVIHLVENKICGVYNCGNDDYVTLVGLVNLMSRIVGKKPLIGFNKNTGNEFPFGNENCIISNQKLKELGLTFTSLTTGLKKDYLAYYKSHI